MALDESRNSFGKYCDISDEILWGIVVWGRSPWGRYPENKAMMIPAAATRVTRPTVLITICGIGRVLSALAKIKLLPYSQLAVDKNLYIAASRYQV